MSTQMKAWQLSGPGSIDKHLRLNPSTPKPSSKDLLPGEVMIQVLVAALNPADYKVPELGLAAKAMISFPKTPGMDVVGKVVALGTSGVGGGTAGVGVGDLVMARVDPSQAGGALSEFVVVPAEAYTRLAPDADLEAAAGIITAGLTAYQIIQPYVKEGDRVFINGGSGAVGLYGTQIAKHLGCHVTVSCSTGKKEMCSEAGADVVIDYKLSDVTEELKKSDKPFNHLVDNVGASPSNLYVESRHFLTPEASYVVISMDMSWGGVKQAADMALRPAILGGGQNHVVTYKTKSKKEDLGTLATWLDAGFVKTRVDEAFAFEDADKALEKLKAGRHTGKIVVHVLPKSDW